MIIALAHRRMPAARAKWARIIIMACVAMAVPATGMAAIVNTSGASVLVSAPLDVSTNGPDSGGQVWVFDEAQHAVLTQSVVVHARQQGIYDDSGDMVSITLPAGAVVSSHYAYIRHEPPPNSISVDGSLTFDAQIMGVILCTPHLTQGSNFLGAPGTTYPNQGGVLCATGVGTDLDSGDRVTIEPDGRTITYHLSVGQSGDRMRILTVGGFNQAVVFVNSSAAGAATGTSWTDAFPNLSAALSAASQSGGVAQQVWVAAGTHHPDATIANSQGNGDRTASFGLVNGVTVYGGFSGGETALEQRNIAGNATTLSGDLAGDDAPVLNPLLAPPATWDENSLHVVRATGGVTGVIDGCTITHGRANLGNGSDAVGAAMLIESANATLRDCTLTDCASDESGGAMSVRDGQATLVRCALRRNRAEFAGGAVGLKPGATARAINCTFLGNRAGNTGGAVEASASGVTLSATNCSFVGNRASGNGGGALSVAAGGATATVANCTLAANSAPNVTQGSGGGGIRHTAGTLILRNAILWGNSDSAGSGESAQYYHDPAITPDISYCLLQGFTDTLGGLRNIGGDPVFASAPNPGADGNWDGANDSIGDLRPRLGSPAIDAARVSDIPLDIVDMDGDSNTNEATPFDAGGQSRRIADGYTPDTGAGGAPAVDMGAFEYLPAAGATTAIVFVHPSSTGMNNGGSWADAYTDLQTALSAAANSGGITQEVWVAAGNYRPAEPNGPRAVSFRAIDGIPIYGGFAGDETTRAQRNPTANITTLSGDLNANDGANFQNNGDNSLHVVNASNLLSTALLDGVTITAGNANGVSVLEYSGGGVLINDGGPVIRNCRIEHNAAGEAGGAYVRGTPLLDSCQFIGNVAVTGRGGGAETIGGATVATYKQCTFVDNRTFNGHGGGMANLGNATVRIVRCQFIRNQVMGGQANDGGAIHATTATTYVINCVFQGNSSSGTGGAITTRGSSPVTLANSLFVGNTAPNGGAIAHGLLPETPGTVVISNCTLAQNVAAMSGGGVFVAGGSLAGPTINNSVLWNNRDSTGTGSGAQIYPLPPAITAIVNRCTVQGDWTASTDVNGFDPGFVRNPSPGPDGNWDGMNDDYGDLRLRIGATAIDRGNTALLPVDTIDLDADGNTTERIPYDLDDAARRIEDLYTPQGGAGPAQDLGAYEFLPPPPASTAIVYVKSDVAGANNGASWATAYRDLSTALCAAANSNGVAQQIWVAAGPHRPTSPGGPRSISFHAISGLAVYGGFAGTESAINQRDLAANQTILSGDLNANDVPSEFPNGSTYSDNAYHVLTTNLANATAAWDGLVISGGHADGPTSGETRGAGIYGANLGGLTLRQVTITRNYASGPGAGMYNDSGSSPRLSDCALLENHANGSGGGAYNRNSSNAVLVRCLFMGNRAGDQAGAIATDGSDTLAASCRFLANVAGSQGGALTLLDSAASATVVNCSLVGNRAGSSGGAFFGSSGNPGLSVFNSTFVANVAGGVGGGIRTTGTLNVVNSILWNNVDNSGISAAAQITATGGIANVNYSLVQGGWAGMGGAGILTADPLFRILPSDGGNGWGDDPSTPLVDEGLNDFFGDLHPGFGSPVTDAGSVAGIPPDSADLDNDANTTEATPLDQEGLARRTDDPCTADTGIGGPPIVDMGAFESNPPPLQSVLYVHSAAIGANNGTSWLDAFTNLQDAICAALSMPGVVREIWVGEGTYRPNLRQTAGDPRSAAFAPPQGITLLGGFAGTEADAAERRPANHPTILSGDLLENDDPLDFPPDPADLTPTWNDNAYQVLRFTGESADTTLDGFIVRAGNADGAGANNSGGGAFVDGVSPMFMGCTFESNNAVNGGGIGLAHSAAPMVKGCTFQHNHARNLGGAAYLLSTGAPMFRECVFLENTADDDVGDAGGAMACTVGAPLIVQCRFTRNRADRGGAIFLGNTAIANLISCVFQGNRAPQLGGAIANVGTAPRIINCSFTGNTSLGNANSVGGAIFNNVGNSLIANCSFTANRSAICGGINIVGSSPTITNCVVWNNTDNNGQGSTSNVRREPTNPGNPVVTYSLVQGGWTGGGGTGNLPGFTDPMFALSPSPGGDGNWGTSDDVYADLRTAMGSMLIDAGNNNAIGQDLGDLDCDGNLLEPTPLDVLGSPRRVDTDSSPDTGFGAAPLVDIGAHEYGPLSGLRIYVNAAAPPNGDGLTWPTAMNDVQGALNSAMATSGCGALEIWVAVGVYHPAAPGGDPESTFQLRGGVGLYGGFAGNESLRSQRNPNSNPTILSGDLNDDDAPDPDDDNVYHVLTTTGGDATAIVDGFIIQGGRADDPRYGGGLISQAGGASIVGCLLRNNAGACAADMAISGGQLTLESVTVSAAPGGVGLNGAAVNLVGTSVIETGGIDLFGADIAGTGSLKLLVGTTARILNAPPCESESILAANGDFNYTTVFLPQETEPVAMSARWEITSTQLRDVRVSGSARTWYIAPSAALGSATLAWRESYLERDLSSGGRADARFHDGGTLTISGELFDSNDPLAEPIFVGELLTARVGAFRVRERLDVPDVLQFIEPPLLTPTGGFLVNNPHGFAISGDQVLTLDLPVATQDGNQLTSFSVNSTILLSMGGGLLLTPAVTPRTVTTIRGRIEGGGVIDVMPGARLVVEGGGTLDLADTPPIGDCADTGQSAAWGLVNVNGELVVRNGAVRNARVRVNLGDVGSGADIVNNDVQLLQSSLGFGGQFFATAGAQIRCNVVTSDGDRYLDLDPDPTVPRELRPMVTGNQFHVIIRQGAGGAVGELLELRTRDYDSGIGAGQSGAHQLTLDSDGYHDTWVLERLIVEAGAKVTLTNRQGFDFTPPTGIPEALYVKELVLGEDAVLNTGLQRLYYQTLTMAQSARIVDYPLLGFPLKIIQMEDATEFAVRVRTLVREPVDQPNIAPFREGAITRELSPDADVNPGNHAMKMTTRRCMPADPCALPAARVVAKGAFARAGEESITVAFSYKFCGAPDDELRVYLSSHADIGVFNGPLLASIRPPTAGPGSINSTRFATFSGRFPRGMLNFRRGTYVELELRDANTTDGVDSCVWIDEFDPVSCPGPGQNPFYCADYTRSNTVTGLDFMLLAASVGNGLTGSNHCLDRGSDDGFIDVGDVLRWDAQLHAGQPNLCDGTLQSNDPPEAVGVNPPQDRLIVSGLSSVAVTPAGAPQRYPDGLHAVNVSAATIESSLLPPGTTDPEQANGYSRILGDSAGDLYQLHAVHGLIRMSDGQRVVRPGLTTFDNHQVYIGLSFAGGRPLQDAAFSPLAGEADVVYVSPVIVSAADHPDQPYIVAARLRLNDNPNEGEPNYTVERLLGSNPWFDEFYNALPPEYSAATTQDYRELEVDPGGHVFITTGRATNTNNWLLVFNGATGAAEAGGPVSLSPTVSGASGLCLSASGEFLYMASAVEDSDPANTLVHRYRLTRAGGGVGPVTAVALDQSYQVSNMRFVSALLRHPTTGAVWALGYSMPVYDVSAITFCELLSPAACYRQTPTCSCQVNLFYSPRLAQLPATGDQATAVAITGGSLSLPISAAFAAAPAPPCRPGDMNADGQITSADVPLFAALLVQGTSDPIQTCRADLSGDGTADAGDIAQMVQCVISGGCP